MLCYIVLCYYVMLCYVILCYVIMLCYEIMLLLCYEIIKYKKVYDQYVKRISYVFRIIR